MLADSAPARYTVLVAGEQAVTEDIKREEMRRKIQALLNTEGRSEEEAASYVAQAMRLMEQYDLEMEDVQGQREERRTYVTKKLNVKYANAWRVHLCSVIASNTGVYLTFSSRADTIWYHGQEHSVEGAAIVAEYMVGTVERLSKQHSTIARTGTKGRRDFAEGCASRLRARIRESSNLGSDPRLPVLHASMIKEAKLFVEGRLGTINNSSRLGNKRSAYTGSYLEGAKAADHVDLRGHQRTEKIA